MYDIIIKNGKIIDGTGKQMFKGDIAIKEDKIKEIGSLHNDTAEKIIDAKGLYVVPGFVDVNNHSDTYWRIFANPKLESLVHQGVTSIIGGNCGSSLAPLVDKNIVNSIQKWTDISNININWLKVSEFLDELDKKDIAVNFATLIGHSTLRRGLIHDQVRSLSAYEIEKINKVIASSLKEGAIGFSTGLVYTHAKLASESELISFASTVTKNKGIYVTHIRGEAHELIESVEEALIVAKHSGVKLHISHLKAMGRENWGLMDKAIAMIEKAGSEGIDVTFDFYPYTSTGSVLYILLPDWVAEGGKKMMLERLKDPDIRKKVIKEMQEDSFDYSKVVISISPLDKTLARKKIVDIAKSQEKSIEGAIVDMLVASGGRIITNMEVLSEKNIEKAVKSPFSIVSSNGSGYNIEHKETGELVHPRNFGSFPRVLSKYVREKKILTWEEAIHKMTGKPANNFKLKKRGEIKKENFADLVIFDPEEIKDLATNEKPYQYSQGINSVIINGKIALHKGKLNEKLSGRVIRNK